MTEPPNQSAEISPLGVDFVFEMGMKKIEEQVKQIEALDLKIGILFGFLGAMLAGFLAVIFAASRENVTAVGLPEKLLLAGVVLTPVAVVFTYKAFRLHAEEGTPRFQDIFPWALEDPKETKRVFLDTLREGVERIAVTVEAKQRNALRATRFVLFAYLAFLVAIIIAVGRTITFKI